MGATVLLFVGLGIVALAIVQLPFGVGYIASQRILRGAGGMFATRLRVVRVDDRMVTLPRNDVTTRQGVYGITWRGGWAILDKLVTSDANTVTWSVHGSSAYLAAGVPVSWHVPVFSGNPRHALNIPYMDVAVPSPLGDLPAWFVRGQRDTWVLLYHGFQATREEGLRVLPTLMRLGYPILDQTYRNDREAPASPDGYYHLGDTEWQDVEAGVRYALDCGARNVILMGWSMGGCIVETFLRRSSLAYAVRAVVYDSPALNWHAVITAQLHSYHLPGWTAYVTEWLLRRRAGLSVRAMDYLAPAPAIRTPTLLFQGTADKLVPVVVNDRFAAANPGRVTYVRVEGAGHTSAWNLSPEDYERALAIFLG